MMNLRIIHFENIFLSLAKRFFGFTCGKLFYILSNSDKSILQKKQGWKHTLCNMFLKHSHKCCNLLSQALCEMLRAITVCTFEHHQVHFFVFVHRQQIQ